MLEAEVTPSGGVLVEGQHVGHLTGFRFTADPEASGEAAKTLNAAAQKALSSEIESRARRLNEAVDDAFLLANDGIIRWLGEAVGAIWVGPHVLRPRVSILADEQLTGQALAMVERRLDLWLAQHVTKLLGPLSELENGEGLEGIARGLAFQIAESLGVLDRARVTDEVKSLSQDDRAALRKFGVRFGAYHLYLPNLIKPAPRALAAQLHALKNGVGAIEGLDDVLHLAASGRTSFAASKDIPKNLYRAAGFRVCGNRAVRVDILERLADLIRPAVSYRPGVTPGDPPQGAADGDGFVVTVAMTSLAGCSGDSFASILHALGYQPEWRKGPAITRRAPVQSEGLLLHSGSTAEEASDCAIDVLPQTAESPVPAEPVADLGSSGVDASATEHRREESESAVSPKDFSCRVGNPPESAAEGAELEKEEEGPHAHGRAGSNNSLAEIADSEQEIEIWRPHRQRHHPRKSEPRANKRHSGRGDEGPVAALRVTAAKPPSSRPAGPREVATGMPAEGGETPAESADSQRGLEHRALRDRRKDSGERRPGEQPARGELRHKGRKQGGRENRGGADERGERPGERFAPQGKRSRPSERPPDPNSPFAKLLVLKARLEEKNNPEV
jgi:ATP-dependent RNA helicase SUPV3L1/SUV3